MFEYRVGEIFRLNGKTYQCVTDFAIVTEPEEGMLFRATNGVLYELKTLGATCKKCGCDTNLPNNLSCHEIDRQAFGKTQINSMHWYPVEEKKEEEKEMEEKKRHIELAVVKVEGDEVTFQITEQTHRCDDFTPGGIPFKSSCGVTLRSVSVPDVSTRTGNMYVRGEDERFDKKHITVSALHFAQIMEAVNEYNETDGMGYKNQWPKTGDLYYYVDTDGSVESCQYADKYDIDNNRRKAGNFFKTEEAAAIVAKRVKAVFKSSVEDGLQ